MPIKTYRIQSGYSLRQKYSVVLQYAYSVDNIVSIPKITDGNFIFTRPENARYQNQMLMMLSIPVKIADFWESSNKFNFIYRDFRLPELNEFYKSYFVTIESTQSFYLPKDISFDIDLSYSSPNRYNYMYNYGNFSCNFSAVVPLLNEQAQLRFGVSDIFNTDRNKYSSNINGIYQYDYTKYKTRNVFLQFTFYIKSGKEVNDISSDSSVSEILERTGK